MKHNHLKGLLIVFIGVLVITPDSLLIRLINGEFWSVTFWRGLLGGVIVLFLLLISNAQKTLTDLRKNTQFDYLASIVFACGTITFVFAVNNTYVATVLLLLSTAPIFAAILSYFFLKEKTDKATLIGITFCIVGILVITVGDKDSPTTINSEYGTVLGGISALVAAFFFAASITLSRSHKQRNIPLNFAIGSFMSAVICLPLADSILDYQNQQWLWLVLMGLVVIPLSYNLILHGSKFIQPALSSVLIQIEALLGPLWVWLVLGEIPHSSTLLGGTIIVVSLLVLNIYNLTKKSSENSLLK